MTEPVIEAVHLEKMFGSGAGQVKALRGVDLKLTSGELVLLMGPSGSGKTTLLSLLGCILTPTRGNVRIRGHATNGASRGALAKFRRDHIGFVFQSYHLFPTLSALDNVRLALDIRGISGTAAERRAAEMLDMVGLRQRCNAFPRELSGGEQQRVAIARAVVGNPSAVLADEPTGALDGETGQAVMKLLAGIARERSHSVLVVTHDPRVIPFANRILYIEDGLIAREERCNAVRLAG